MKPIFVSKIICSFSDLLLFWWGPYLTLLVTLLLYNINLASVQRASCSCGQCCGFASPWFGSGSDPAFHFHAYPDPNFHCEADPYPPLTFFKIWTLRCFKMTIRLPPFHFDADLYPDPAFHFDPDPDLASQNDGDPCGWKRNIVGGDLFVTGPHVGLGVFISLFFYYYHRHFSPILNFFFYPDSASLWNQIYQYLRRIVNSRVYFYCVYNALLSALYV